MLNNFVIAELTREGLAFWCFQLRVHDYVDLPS